MKRLWTLVASILTGTRFGMRAAAGVAAALSFLTLGGPGVQAAGDGLDAQSAWQQTELLPVTMFIDALPLLRIQGWFDPATGNLLFIDAYGKRDALFGLNLGTSVTGRVTVKYLGDGRQRVTVVLHTKDAICWGFNAGGQPAFGYGPIDVLRNVGAASLGDSMTRVEFTQPVGPIDPSVPWDSLTATVRCDGELRHGSGFPDGTQGFAQTTQIGLFGTGAAGGCPPERDGDCFPADEVRFRPRGKVGKESLGSVDFDVLFRPAGARARMDCQQAGVSLIGVDVFDSLGLLRTSLSRPCIPGERFLMTIEPGAYTVRARGQNDQLAICYESAVLVTVQGGQTRRLSIIAEQHPNGAAQGCVYPSAP